MAWAPLKSPSCVATCFHRLPFKEIAKLDKSELKPKCEYINLIEICTYLYIPHRGVSLKSA